MTRKKPSSRDQKAFTIHDANLSTVEEQENELIEELAFTALICQQHIHLIRTGRDGRDVLISDLEKQFSSASRSVRQLRKLWKEVG